MIDNKYIELMNKEIDGEITKAEQEKLNRYLSANPEAQNFYDELRQTSDLLGTIPRVEPSPNIKKYVMNSIDLTRYSTSKNPSKFRSLVLSLFAKPSPKLAYAFALGIVVGILMYLVVLENVISKRGIDVTDFYGTIGISEKTGFKTLKAIPIALPEINGTIAIKRLENIFVIETDLNALQETEIQLEYDESYLQFSHFNSGSRSKLSFDFGENYIRTSCLGDVQYGLFFTEVIADGKPIIIKLFVAGELRHTQNISL